MGFWDKGTHMTKQEWRGACQRMLNRLETLKSEADAYEAQGRKSKQAEGQKPKTR
jgi:hypothetical protein